MLLLYSGNAEVKQIDMLHAADYGQMNLANLKEELDSRKKFDKQIETKMQYVKI